MFFRKKIKELEGKIKDLELDIFLIHSPYLYKIGQKISIHTESGTQEFVVIKRSVSDLFAKRYGLVSLADGSEWSTIEAVLMRSAI